MDIPSQFTFIKWLKTDKVALAENKFGKRLVVKPSNYAKYLAGFSQLVITQTRTLRLIMPQIFAEGDYIYHEYITGELAGGTTGSYGFSTQSLEMIDVKVLAQAFYELHTLSSAQFFLMPKSTVPSFGMSRKNFVLEERLSRWYINNLEETKEAVSHHLGLDCYLKFQNFLSSNARIIDGLSKFLVNGDLHPENILVKALIAGEAKDFILSDWDLLHFNNPGYDLADLYVWSWKNKDWRDSLVKEYKLLYQGNLEELSVCLKYCQLYLAAQMVKHTSIMLDTNLNNEDKQNANGLLENSKELLINLISN